MNVNTLKWYYQKQIDPYPLLTFRGLSLYRRTQISVSLKHKCKQESPGAFHCQVLNVKTTVRPRFRVRVSLFLSVMIIPEEIIQAFFCCSWKLLQKANDMGSSCLKHYKTRTLTNSGKGVFQDVKKGCVSIFDAWQAKVSRVLCKDSSKSIACSLETPKKIYQSFKRSKPLGTTAGPTPSTNILRYRGDNPENYLLQMQIVAFFDPSLLSISEARQLKFNLTKPFQCKKAIQP